MRPCVLILSLALFLPLSACSGGAPSGGDAMSPAPAPTAEPPSLDRSRLSIFAPLPTTMEAEGRAITPARVELGRMLYFDKRLSKNHDIACNSCHQLDKYGVDGQPTSSGHKGQRGGRNSPSVYNAGGHIAQFWDGRAADVEAQAKGPILNPIEMAMPSEDAVLTTLRSIPGYVERFGQAFANEAEPLSYDTMAQAIGAFERTLVTPGRWDLYLDGEDDALSASELDGLRTFLDTGCGTCHSGPYVGGSMYQKVGLVKPWPSQADTGRGALTGKAQDKMFFKVPSLRNIEHTGPYFHDGSVADLSVAVSMMAEYQLGKQLSSEQVGALVSFLSALSGELPKQQIAAPRLPPSTEGTPKPDPS